MSDGGAPFRLGGGRDLPPLLFLTSTGPLSARIGADESAAILDAVRNAGHAVADLAVAPADLVGATAGASRALADHPDVQGVVIVGGPDVVPAFRVNVLPPDLVDRVNTHVDDPYDHFVVWNDDVYGDTDADGLAELPVSRAPDGGSATFLATVLGAAGAASGSGRGGIRNAARPFAGPIFDGLAGTDPMFVSAPTRFDAPAYALMGDCVYVMLHGSYEDTSRFWGEDAAAQPVAMAVSNVPAGGVGVVLAGCCWGALLAGEIAAEASLGAAQASRPVSTSIALTFLGAGAVAFVGCTGLHYSPVAEPYEYNGGPLHRAFWTAIRAGTAPAVALHQAKGEYLAAIPHGDNSAQQFAHELKLFREFTCLGLGW